MSDMSSMNREKKKRQLRQQIVTAPQPAAKSRNADEDSEAVLRQAHKKVRKRRFRIFLVILVLLAMGGIGLYQYIKHHQYTDYSVMWEKPMEEGSFVGYLSYGGNVLKYTKDGASYIDIQGKNIWALSYEMKAPIAAVNGNYVAIADQQGNSIYIFDKTGNIGMATTLLPILKVTISAHGVVAVIEEDATANYIDLFKNDGTSLKITIKGLLDGEVGYPMDISLSPDGTQLMGAYVCLKNGAVNGRVAFHNFSEIGKSIPTRVVGGFDEQYASDIVSRVHFLSDTYSCAFSSNSISFFSTKNVLSPELLKQQTVEEEIRSVFYSDKYVGVIVASATGMNSNRMDIYKADGSKAFSKEFDYQYKYADIDGENVILYNEDSCKVYNMSGIEKFSGQFDFTVAKIRNGRFPNTLVVTGPQNMKEIKLQ